MTTWIDATWADGPKVFAYINRNFPLWNETASDAFRRQMDRCKRGTPVGVLYLDEVLTKLGGHISHVPNDVWLERRPGLKERKRPAPRKTLELKNCIVCGETIPPVWANGTKMTPARYDRRTTCKRECAESLKKRGDFKFGKAAA